MTELAIKNLDITVAIPTCNREALERLRFGFHMGLRSQTEVENLALILIPSPSIHAWDNYELRIINYE